MAIGDRYLATVEVEQVADTEYRWEGAKISIFSDEIKSLEKMRKPLPTKVGSVVQIATLNSARPIFAMLRDGGDWTTTRYGEMSVMSGADISDTNWSLVS